MPEHIEQQSQAWRDSRAGKVTASKISAVFAKAKKGATESATRSNYRAKLICEILSGKALDDEYESWQMKRGTRLEPDARVEYELRTSARVDTAGFIDHPTIPRFGASADGVVGKEGLVQFKCPLTATHLDWLMRKVVPAEHKQQMFAELACYPDRKWNEFVSYDPNLPQHLQLFVVRLMRDEVEIESIETEVMKFNAEVDEIIAKLPKENGSEDLTEVLTESLKAAQHEK